MQGIAAVERATGRKLEGAPQREGESGLGGNEVEVVIGILHTD